jgi:hypothetical protein
MVFPTALAERELICPQLEHAILTDKQLGAINKHLGPPPTLILANLTYHESRSYPSRLHMSNPVRMNWPAIEERRYLMTHFNTRPQTVFLILKSLANHIKHSRLQINDFLEKIKNLPPISQCKTYYKNNDLKNFILLIISNF